MNTKIKIILIFLCLTLMVGCTTTGQAYLPRTSRVFHANKNCVGCYGSNPIVFQSVQAAANSGGIAPCNLCVKPQGSSSQGYTVHNYSASTPVTSSTNFNRGGISSYKKSAINNSSGNTGFGNFNTNQNIYINDQKKHIGNLSNNPLNSNSVSNQLGAGNPLLQDSINNPLGVYGSPLSSKSVNNPLATDAPKLYDSQGRYRGKLSNNQLDPDSISNPLGRYGSPISPDSINNPIGAGNPLLQDSPNNPLGSGWTIIGQ